ncbi:hypothetical protein Acid345_2700 [Candidatus Koribacter versatilis Ellin345]|uniref:Lipoprotein n=1 Tax=Koribacter versatilis (strain Ellin345) TaxID=204669 RepID=Q1IN49_KORVE|nr:hypothetical protein [Candidatus Koribacter versatilis]ABF41701.1 hypothetical protein Acid345_2700 [Candidatus Koribacter versatilis Ellin345]
MKKCILFLAVLSLLFLVACGGSTSFNPGTGSSGFSNASFSGTYVFTMSGQCFSACSTTGIVQSAGTLVADGKGNISSGFWDLNIGGQYHGSPLSLTGTYTVNADGTASVMLNNTLATNAFVIMLSGPEGGSIVSNDGAWALAGKVAIQSSAAIAAQPNAAYVYRVGGLDASFSSWAFVGVMDFNSRAVTADSNQNGSINLLQTGTLIPVTYDATSGRGTVTLAPSGTNSIPTQNYVYYVVDANTLELVSTDASLGFQGRAELSSGAVGAPLTGSFAFLAAGFPVTGTIQVTEGGIFTGDGAGGITSGVIDTVFDNSGNTGASLTATGSVTAAQGVTRDVLTLTPGSTLSMTSAVLWMTSANRGFFLTLNTDRAETGTINVQSGAPFTDSATFSSYQSGFAITTGGAQGLAYATLFKNSSGTISGYTQTINLFGTAGSNTGNGSLSFDSTGTIGSLTLNNTLQNGTEDIRFYQYSSSDAFMMQADQGIISSGQMRIQTAQ